LEPGEILRKTREHLGLTIRHVEAASLKLVEKYSNHDFGISISRLSDIETKGIVPSIFKLYSLAAIYHTDLRRLLELYGIKMGNLPSDHQLLMPPRTHPVTGLDSIESVQVPVRLDPGFDPRSTSILGRFVMNWGAIPMAYLNQFNSREFSYGYVGSEDWTMFPLLQPGSLVQIDESETTVQKGSWLSEYERPIYFVELRDSFRCCWCELSGSDLLMLAHPLSQQSTRVARNGHDAEILGQVVGIAMRLDFRRRS
jgi:transcriptional regulator with XRE-family HTH domain